MEFLSYSHGKVNLRLDAEEWKLVDTQPSLLHGWAVEKVRSFCHTHLPGYLDDVAEVLLWSQSHVLMKAYTDIDLGWNSAKESDGSCSLAEPNTYWLVTYEWIRYSPGADFNWKRENEAIRGCPGMWWAQYLEKDRKRLSKQCAKAEGYLGKGQVVPICDRPDNCDHRFVGAVPITAAGFAALGWDGP